MSGDAQNLPKTPGDAIADQAVWREQGLRQFEAYLEKQAAFSLYLEELGERRDREQDEEGTRA